MGLEYGPHSIAIATDIEEVLKKEGRAMDIKELSNAIPGKVPIREVAGAAWRGWITRGHLRLRSDSKFALKK